MECPSRGKDTMPPQLSGALARRGESVPANSEPARAKVLISGFAAAGIAAFAPPPAAAAEFFPPAAAEEIISPIQDNIRDYLERNSGKTVLKTAENGRSRRYFVNGALDLDALALDSPLTSLVLDRSRAAGDGTQFSAVHELEIAGGRLAIRAGLSAGAGEDEQTAFYFKESADGASAPLFRLSGGTAEISARNKATAMEGANFYSLEGGDFDVRAEDAAAALRLYYTDLATGAHNGADVFFSQTGGKSSFAAAGSAVALNSNQSVELSGGLIAVRAADKAQAIALEDADTQFIQKGGAAFITAGGESAGLKTGQLRLEGGTLALRSGGSGKAVHIVNILHEDFSEEGGLFRFSGGSLEISKDSGSAGGYALYGDGGSRAEFAAGSIFKPVLDADAAGAPIAGLASFGSVRIAPQALLAFTLKNSGKITVSAPLSLNFLESRETAIDGDFTLSGPPGETLSGEKLFFRYRLQKSPDGKRYQLYLLPKSAEEADGKTAEAQQENSGALLPETAPPPALRPLPEPKPSLKVSDIMSGNLRRAAKAAENAAGRHDSPAYQAAAALYDRFYNSGSGERRQIERGLRGLSPHQATRLPALSLAAQRRFAESARSHSVRFYRAESGAEDTESENAPLLWFSRVGARSRLRAQNSAFSALSAGYGGFNFGAAAKTEKAALALAGETGFGRLSGAERYHARRRHIFFGAGYARPLRPGKKFPLLLGISASAGRSRYQQRRFDPYGNAAAANIRQNSFLASAAVSQTRYAKKLRLQFAPQAGADYGYIRQSGWREKGSVLALKTDSAHYESFISKIGAALRRDCGRLSLSAAVFHRYAFAGKNMSLQTGLRGAPAMRWRERGETGGRNAAELTLRAEGQPAANIRFSGLYRLLRQARRSEKNFAAEIKMLF